MIMWTLQLFGERCNLNFPENRDEFLFLIDCSFSDEHGFKDYIIVVLKPPKI